MPGLHMDAVDHGRAVFRPYNGQVADGAVKVARGSALIGHISAVFGLRQFELPVAARRKAHGGTVDVARYRVERRLRGVGRDGNVEFYPAAADDDGVDRFVCGGNDRRRVIGERRAVLFRRVAVIVEFSMRRSQGTLTSTAMPVQPSEWTLCTVEPTISISTP